ncbi:MAG: NAD-dependent epimerase/dehydratase family protein [Clostridiales bacterium]|jgi:nucleoside-diphosphate-sugar epimerase|nr:NAD-dependent epimerase/dehydratase family protein [Clostridiales bacterium]
MARFGLIADCSGVQINVDNVAAFAEANCISKILFTSSIAPYGAWEELKDEGVPNTPYGASKLVAEKVHNARQASGVGRSLT